MTDLATRFTPWSGGGSWERRSCPSSLRGSSLCRDDGRWIRHRGHLCIRYCSEDVQAPESHVGMLTSANYEVACEYTLSLARSSRALLRPLALSFRFSFRFSFWFSYSFITLVRRSVAFSQTFSSLSHDRFPVSPRLSTSCLIQRTQLTQLTPLSFIGIKRIKGIAKI